MYQHHSYVLFALKPYIDLIHLWRFACYYQYLNYNKGLKNICFKEI